MDVVVVGVSHHTSTLELRERLAMDNAAAVAMVQELCTDGSIIEGLAVSTCNRVEVYALTRNAQQAIDGIAHKFATRNSLTPHELVPNLYKESGKAAVQHLFAVTSSLESIVVGEPQILGQMKEAYAAAQDAKLTGAALNRLMHRAFSVAKRVRTETQISRLAISVSSVAVDLSKKIFQNLSSHKVMLVGAGEMAELAARHFHSAGIKELIVLNRTYEKASALAQEFGAVAAPFEKMHAYLADVDIALFSAGAPYHLVKAAEVEAIMKQRRNRPLFLIDIAVPRNIDPKCGKIDDVFLYDVDDLQQIADSNRSLRSGEADAAHAIVNDETDRYVEWTHAQQVFPIIARLTSRAETMRKAELERTLASLNLAGQPELVEKLERMTSALVSKLLHQPIQAIKQAQATDDAQSIEAACRIFGLDEDATNPSAPVKGAAEARKKA